MTITAIRYHLESYQEARRILASNFTTVVERKAAIHIRDEFIEMAPSYVNQLVELFDMLSANTDGEECTDVYNCGQATATKCTRCRVREIAAE